MIQSVIARLLATSAVTAIIGTRLYPLSRTQGSALPAVTISQISGGPLYADEGEAGLAESRVQVDCWADDYPGAKNLAAAVKTSLSGLSTDTLPHVELDIERDLREGGGNAEDYPFRVSLDFIVWSK